MANLVEKINLIMVEQDEDGTNHNKFWNASLNDDNSVFVEWARVGKTPQTQIKNFGSKSEAKVFINKKINEKVKKGYEQLEVVSNVQSTVVSSAKSINNASLKSVAKSQIKHSNPIVASLIDYFTQVNAHTIMESTKGAIQFNDTTGLYSTALGIVGQNSLDEANRLLVEIGDIVAINDHNNPKLRELSQRYLRYIPTDIGMKRFDPIMFWRSLYEVQAQKQIVDALQVSLVSATTSCNNQLNTAVKNNNAPQIFDVQLELVEDESKISKIKDLYEKSKGSHSDVRRYKVKTVYKVYIASEREAFKRVGAKLDNIWTLYHGTAAANCLSILKQGLVIPPASSSHCTGRLYGDGVYGSDQSTKSLRYATGAWGGKTSNRTFMFIMDMAMGKYYEPDRRSYMSTRYPVRGYNSTFARAGKGGVQNNEMIVYNVAQVQLKYLVEFSS